jgi:hypothetical protein
MGKSCASTFFTDTARKILKTIEARKISVSAAP